MWQMGMLALQYSPYFGVLQRQKRFLGLITIVEGMSLGASRIELKYSLRFCNPVMDTNVLSLKVMNLFYLIIFYVKNKCLYLCTAYTTALDKLG